MSKRVAIVGATLSGCITAYHLSRLGYDVDLFDSLPSFDTPVANTLGEKFPIEDHLFYLPMSSTYIEKFLKHADLYENITIASIVPKDISVYHDGLRSSSFYSMMSGRIYLALYFTLHYLERLFTRGNRHQSKTKTIGKYFEDCYGSRFSSNIALPLVDAIYGSTPSYLKVGHAFSHTQVKGKTPFINIFNLSKSWFKSSKPIIEVAFYKGGQSGLAQDIIARADINVHHNHTVTSVYPQGTANATHQPLYGVVSSRGDHRGYSSVVITTDAHTTSKMIAPFDQSRCHQLVSALSRVPYVNASNLYLLYNTNQHLDFSILLTPFYERGLISSIANLSKMIGDNKHYSLLRININMQVDSTDNLWDDIINELYDTLSRKMVPIEIVQSNYRACNLHTSVDYAKTANLIDEFEQENKGVMILGDFAMEFPHNSMMKKISQRIFRFHYT